MTPTTVAVDIAATARLTRLVTTDTVPPARWLRAKILARWPAPGDAVPEAWASAPNGWRNRLNADSTEYVDARGHPSPEPASWEVRVHGTGRWLECEIDYDALGQPGATTPTSLVWTKGTPVGELITCPWCSSMYVGAAVVALRWCVPGVWDPLARILAGSLAAGLVAQGE